MKKDVRKALEDAKKLEKNEEPSTDEIVTNYKDAFEQAEQLKKLLRPEWFIKDTDDKKTSKPKKKARSPTRKKKTL